MKLQFDSQLSYQENAVQAVVDLFQGQSIQKANFSISDYMSREMELGEVHVGIGNRLELLPEDILENLRAVQIRNELAPSEHLADNRLDFDIEMETGTGKTYVYIRSILELNKRYGFTKFIIVVPSIPIKEGVFKTLQITKNHFANLYDNLTYDYFIYDSGRLNRIREFATSDTVQIMIINIDAFRKSFEDPTKEDKANLIHRTTEKLNGLRPIELIQETNPIVIIDEPQSVDTTPKSKDAIASLNPLVIFRYSATHVEKHNLVYKLNAIDSYNLQLVKEIEVAGFESKDSHNEAYMQLQSVNNKKSPITAKIVIDKKGRNSIKRTAVTVRQGDDFYELSGYRDIYDGYIVNDIYCGQGDEYVDFTSKSDILRIGKAVGDIDELLLKEQQIRKTIEEHLDKEVILNPKGIKVLSLFFIDRVANYRYYDKDGVPQKGIYAKLFEKNYKELIRKPKYNSLFKEIHNGMDDAEQAHGGYFSIDNKKHVKDTSGKTNADESEYNLIMKEKEKLLSFENPLRFIFSHSALREGWDNPNVFQICTLNETQSEVKKRQEIGRGMRLCVNQNGERQHGFTINRLTVMANESYNDFADKLQKEYEDDGIRFGVLESHMFTNVSVLQTDGTFVPLGVDSSKQIYELFVKEGYISATGVIQNGLRTALWEHTLNLPLGMAQLAPQVEAICKKAAGKLQIRNADKKRAVHLNKEIFLNEDFKALWDKIKWKTTYRVRFNTEELIQKCCDAIRSDLAVSSSKLIYRKADLSVKESGIDAIETEHRTVYATKSDAPLPDILTYLQNETNLTRKTLVRLLLKCDRLDLFKKNPQTFMDATATIIRSVMERMIVDGIKYIKIGDDAYYAQELFQTKELSGYLEQNMIQSSRSLFNYVVYDSENEKDFATRFEQNKDVELYAKLPDWFKISTPLGSYNPDWAVLLNIEGEKKLYFVLETKGNMSSAALRPTEQAKINCGKAHFQALGEDDHFECADDFDEFMERHI
ncbi:MAG: DEAD/DEAH box helicase family protein [Megasphaera sp.]|jgi:type III restriction enzyme|nr:DEAD/DEAH box helicase family protein [Megasphaera sp.]